MNLAEIETFLMIVKTKNITKTSENLFLSQPTVSHRLKALENELDMQLITRKKGYKMIELTAKGEEFVPIAERWMALWKEMQMLQNGEEKMYLCVGSTDTLSTTILAPFYNKILIEVPNMDLRLRTHQSYEIYGLLEKHEIDIGFVYHHLHFKNIVSEPLLEEEMYLMRSENAVSDLKDIPLQELDPSKEIFFSWETNYQIWHDQWIESTNRPRIQIDSFGMILNLLENEDMWMIAPASVIRILAKYRNIQVSRVNNEVQPPKRVTYEVRHKNPNKATLKAVKKFDELLADYLNESNWSTYDL